MRRKLITAERERKRTVLSAKEIAALQVQRRIIKIIELEAVARSAIDGFADSRQYRSASR